MKFEEAKQVCEQAFPGGRLERQGNVCIVFDKDGSQLGRALSWESALREAVKPLLLAQEKALADAYEKQERDIQDFMEFLKQRFAREFIEYRNATRAGNSAGNTRGAATGEKQLVQIVPG